MRKIAGLFKGNSEAFRNMSLLIIVFGACLIVSIWAALAINVRSERQSEVRHALVSTANFARALEEHTLRTIKETDQTVLFIKHQYEEEGRLVDIPQYIKQGRLANPFLVLLSVCDENGDLVVSSQVPFVPSNLRDREHIMVHRERDSGELFISKPVLGRSSGKWSIQMTRRINKPDGSFGGVVIASVDPFYFTEFYKQMNLGKNSLITLLGLDGKVRVRYSGEKASIGEDLSDTSLMGMISRGGTGSYTRESYIDGIERLFSYRVMKDYPFVLVVGLETAAVLREADQRARVYFAMAVLTSLAVLFFSVTLLRVSARRKQAEEALQLANMDLESKVLERTLELNAANQELTAVNEEQVAMNENLMHANVDLGKAYSELKNAQMQIIRQEKMASIGQLAAGVAHEINSPLGFVNSNFGTLRKYVLRMMEVMEAMRNMNQHVLADGSELLRAEAQKITLLENEKMIGRILGDIDAIFHDTKDGLSRVGDIVKALRLFSRVDQLSSIEEYDLNQGVKNALIFAQGEIKYAAKVKESLGDIPFVPADSGLINQVILNLLLNAAYAVKENHPEGLGLIRVATLADDQYIYCSVEDNGGGIPDEIRKDIFTPFFTTKPVGQGTGLGLSISYDTVVNKHVGELTFVSKINEGTTFTLKLPLVRPTNKEQAE